MHGPGRSKKRSAGQPLLAHQLAQIAPNHHPFEEGGERVSNELAKSRFWNSVVKIC